MPELGEVQHAASLLKRFLLNRTIVKITSAVDEIVFVKPLVSSILDGLVGSRVTSVGRNGKYFWFECDSSKTLLMHFGMTGWIHVKDVRTHFIAMESGGDKKQKERIKEILAAGGDPAALTVENVPSEVWPPKYMKFVIETDEGNSIAFTDSRRLGRIRLLDMPASEAAKVEPLSKLGRDYSQDQGDLADFSQNVSKRKVPIKALLLDQSVFSGIGNWMADEIIFQARVHPEQYSNTLDSTQLETLYAKLIQVCELSAKLEGNTAGFPADWLMLHRWGKGRKAAQTLPSGHTVEHITVGGRTSCYVPELQILPKVEDDIKDEPDVPSKKRRRKN